MYLQYFTVVVESKLAIRTTEQDSIRRGINDEVEEAVVRVEHFRLGKARAHFTALHADGSSRCSFGSVFISL